MLNDSDLIQMLSDAAEIVGDNETSITIRRGTSTLAAQDVRIAGAGRSSNRRDSEGGQESRGSVIVCGSSDLDIVVGDRFTSSSVLYRVTYVRPSRLFGIVAEAEAVQ
jgi:hypothetical protein